MVRRSTLAAAVVLTCAAAVSSVGGAASAAQTSAAAPALCTTSQTIQISSLVFQPPAVAPGQSSQATATVVNCTSQTQQASAQWEGRFVGPSGTSFPAGCPVIDPLIEQLNLAPHGSATPSVGYLVPASCTATGLIVTVQIIQQGKVITQRSAELTINQPTAKS